ncbi:MAG: tRNA 2-thiouridine(34) synthase MnmA [Desulfobacterales bacterium]|nr:tRNA 2-thiouridine(34) synthase MnmA [Desulfobacterales bacterium]
MRKRVLVAMSGGVDSSVAACLLQERDYEVIGATMRIWKEEEGKRHLHGCCGVLHVEDARRVAQHMGIPFYVLNLEAEFEKEVVQYFCSEYSAGRTPNPCISCNERVKFGAFLRKALDLEADYIATGHYARLEFDEGTGRSLLKKGLDRRKDQSYVLFSLNQDQLRRTLFPLGEFWKEEVRKKALQLGLRVHNKPESQEICFIHEDSYHPFLWERLKGTVEPGPIMDRGGNVLGNHKGIAFYTIGQRRGLGLAKGIPVYVIGIDRERNAIIVGEEKEVLADTFTVDSLNWIVSPKEGFPLSAQVKIRYNHPGAEAILTEISPDTLEVKFTTPQKAITPGQAAVFYDGETVLGGGWIREVVRNSE